MSDDIYDTFRGRIMIPIRDKQRRIIAFTARILPDILANDTNAPKYINYSKLLYMIRAIAYSVLMWHGMQHQKQVR